MRIMHLTAGQRLGDSEILDNGSIPDSPIEFVREALDRPDMSLGPVQ